MAASPGAFTGVRVFGILNAGSREADFPTASGGTWLDPAGAPDFNLALACLERLVSRGLAPFLPLTFFPPAVSASPIEPPSDFTLWRRLVGAFLDAAVSRFGPRELARWSLEVWNEPNMPPFWRGSFDDYLDLYRSTAAALHASGHRVRLGGPAIAWMPPDEGPALMERFLRFLRDEPDMPCDFISYHRKGAWTDGEGEPRLSRLVEAAETTARLAWRLVPERCARGLVIINDEADMRVGFQRPYAPRLSERFPAWLAATAAAHAALTVRHAAGGLRFAAAADNANQHLVREPFDGRRALMTPTAAERPEDLVKLPVFGFYEMLRLLGGDLCSAGRGDDGMFHLVTADEGRVGVLIAHQPDDPLGQKREIRLGLELRDLPWRGVNVAVFRIDGSFSNAFAAQGRRMPSAPLSRGAARRLRRAAELAAAAPIRRDIGIQGGRLVLRLSMIPFTTAHLWITPDDPAPPATPRWIEASMADGNAVLRWSPNIEPGFYGYEVLRLDTGHRVAPLPLRTAMWVDTAPPRGVALRYAVRAISASGRRSPLVAAPVLRH
jgi:xylan 1,4-beta-xylosidase